MCLWLMTPGSFLQSGLTKAVKESKISLQQAEYEFLSFVRQQTPPGVCPLAGTRVLSYPQRQQCWCSWWGVLVSVQADQILLSKEGLSQGIAHCADSLKWLLHIVAVSVILCINISVYTCN